MQLVWRAAGAAIRRWPAGRPRGLARAGLLATALLAAGCATVNPHHDPRQPHHRPDGFQNRYASNATKGIDDFLRWQAERWLQPAPAPDTPTPVVAPAVAYLQANARAGGAMQPTVTWIGHASTLVQAGGLNLLTDPVFSERASPLSFVGPRRAQPPGLTIAQLPRIDVVLISHNHYDHLDEASVRALAAQPGGEPLFIVPLGVEVWLAERGIRRVVALDWWQTHRPGDLGHPLEVMLTPAQHWSGRGLHDRMATLWGGFAVFTPDLHWLYTGDTGWSPDVRDIAERLQARATAVGGSPQIDLALIPVGAYEPRWFMTTQHVNPDEAVRIHRALGARFSVGVHWGTFALTDEPLDQPPRDLAAARRAQGVADEAFVVLAVGETRRLPARTGAAATPGNATAGPATPAAPAAFTVAAEARTTAAPGPPAAPAR